MGFYINSKMAVIGGNSRKISLPTPPCSGIINSGKVRESWFFGLCYAMDGGYNKCNPYIERHLAIFVNCF
jgi:hypothetical protein